ncbi:MAG: response regulator [Cyanobacteriota bacterium ELA615]
MDNKKSQPKQISPSLYLSLEEIESSLLNPNLQLDLEKLEIIVENPNQSSQYNPIDLLNQSSSKSIEQSMRVPLKELDEINNLIGELVIKKNSIEQNQEKLQQFLENLLSQTQKLGKLANQMQRLYEKTLLEGSLISGKISTTNPTEFDALEMDRFSKFHLLAQEIIESIVRVRESAGDIEYLVDTSEQFTISLKQLTIQLQQGINTARMVKFGNIAEKFARAVKNFSLSLNKQAKLQVEGKDILIDKMLMDYLYDPIVHIVNNAMVHGIETPQQRERQGKSKEGTIIIRSFLQNNQTVIEIEDDGAGIDCELIKEKALKQGLLSSNQADNLKKQEIYDLLFIIGFTTKEKADQFSGRGVGLDIVKNAIKQVRGTLNIESIIGVKTKFTIRLPLTLNICKALFCIIEDSTIAFPLDGIEDIINCSIKDIQINSKEETYIPWKGSNVQFYPLNTLLRLNGSQRTNKISDNSKNNLQLIVLQIAGETLIVQVDEVLAEMEIVIKQILGPIPRPYGIAGVTLLGNGDIVPLANIVELMEIARKKPVSLNLAPKNQALQQQIEIPAHLILIVDDSITVREMLSASFIKMGYRVEQARDGQEAWDKLTSGLQCDLIFCDIEMPRLNGLDFLAKLKEDKKLNTIPVALLTSRAAQKHRNIAIHYGASAYFVKPYREQEILDAAKSIIASSKNL